MTGAPASGAAAGQETTRRRKPARPPTVPLSEFGKAPPPPPRIRLTPRQIATYSASGVVLVFCLWAFSAWVGQRADQIWSNAGQIDQRNR